MANIPNRCLLPFFPSPSPQVKIVPVRVRGGVSSEGDCCVCQYHSNPMALRTWKPRDLDSGMPVHFTCVTSLLMLCQDLQCDLCVAKSSPRFSVLILILTCGMLVALSSVNTLHLAVRISYSWFLFHLTGPHQSVSFPDLLIM